MKSCYGKRLKNKDECAKCKEMEQCSIITLEIIFDDKIVIVV